VIGQAAKLVSAATALKGAGASDETYKAAQEKRFADAKAALSRVSAAQGFIANPSLASGRKFAQALAGQDLSGQVALPAPATYK